ncbi:MAG: type II secretion system F family protein [Actinomycetes bacterium]
MGTIRWTLVILMAVLGLGCCAASVPWWRRASLADRVDAHLRPATGARVARWSWGRLRTVAVRSVGGRLPRGDVAERLAGAGRGLDVVAARTEQAAWALVGLAVGLACDLLAAVAGRGVSPLVGLGLPLCGGVGAAMLWDRRLSRAVEARRRAANAEFPTIADLLCLAVTAGENLRGGLEVVVASSRGVLSAEIAGALRDARTGSALAPSLTARAEALGEPSFERFVRSVLTAAERGIAVADALRAMAADARDAERVALVEAAGRKQVTMLMPVVALILPVALVFAFFPGVVAIRNLS